MGPRATQRPPSPADPTAVGTWIGVAVLAAALVWRAPLTWFPTNWVPFISKVRPGNTGTAEGSHRRAL